VTERLLRTRWLGRVDYLEADALQRALHASTDDYLLLLEHPHVYSLGSRAQPEHVLVPPCAVGAELVRADRGGDVTYHGPGQLVGYPIVTLPGAKNGLRDVVAYVRRLEAVLIAALREFGVDAGRCERLTGVWVGEEKIAAIGVRVARGRTRHGFALNVDPDLSMFDHIVPCGIRDKGVTSIARVLGRAPALRDVSDTVAACFQAEFGYTEIERQAVAPRRTDHGPIAFPPGAPSPGHRRNLLRLAQAGVPIPVEDARPRRPEWMRVRADFGSGYRETKRLARTLALNTVCESAGCPNISECWAEHTATFMILGDRCTRACGFCLVDTQKPGAVDEGEPGRVGQAVAALGLAHAVITSVARDDLADGGASIFAATIHAIRARAPGSRVEVLIPDCGGQPEALDTIFEARPDVLNHNLETVARLQRAARPNAGYARSLSVLARARSADLVTKSGLILGLGEEDHEVRAAIADLRAVGVEILTIGQYLQPSPRHLPVSRWWHPDEFLTLHDYASSLGFAHVEAGPLVRSSYHARRASDVVTPSQRTS
jgi:lipoic acid synthetase